MGLRRPVPGGFPASGRCRKKARNRKGQKKKKKNFKKSILEKEKKGGREKGGQGELWKRKVC